MRLIRRSARIKSLLGVLGLLLLAATILPVAIAVLSDSEARRLEGVSIEQVEFREVRFENTRQGIELAGMLFVPAGDGPFPAAVIIHGSGTSRRDNSWYLTLTEHLRSNGVLVLLPDKRGSEQSEGDWRTASFEDLASDTVTAVEYLRNQPELALSGVGVIGLSQGGHIAPIVATELPDLAFLVNVVGGAIPMHELLIYEETHNLREMGFLPGISDLLARPSAWSLIELRQATFWDAVGNFDPLPYWREVTAPSLVLYGEDDTNVPSSRSAEILRSLGKPNIEVRIYAGSGHALESPPGQGNSIFREDALADITEFILTAVADRE